MTNNRGRRVCQELREITTPVWDVLEVYQISKCKCQGCSVISQTRLKGVLMAAEIITWASIHNTWILKLWDYMRFF